MIIFYFKRIIWSLIRLIRGLTKKLFQKWTANQALTSSRSKRFLFMIQEVTGFKTSQTLKIQLLYRNPETGQVQSRIRIRKN